MYVTFYMDCLLCLYNDFSTQRLCVVFSGKDKGQAILQSLTDFLV